jgi:hypothetical protein
VARPGSRDYQVRINERTNERRRRHVARPDSRRLWDPGARSRNRPLGQGAAISPSTYVERERETERDRRERANESSVANLLAPARSIDRAAERQTELYAPHLRPTSTYTLLHHSALTNRAQSRRSGPVGRKRSSYMYASVAERRRETPTAGGRLASPGRIVSD